MKNDAKTWKMTETLAHAYSPESTQQELANEYQHDRVQMVFKIFASLCLDKRSLSIGRVKIFVFVTDSSSSYPEHEWNNPGNHRPV